MSDNERLKPIQLAPLHMLIKFKRSQRVVDINTKILSRLNVSLLEKTIRFKLNHSFKTVIEGSVIRRPHDHELKDEFYATILICPNPSDWPEPCDLYAKLYCAAICVAVKLAAEKEDPEVWSWPSVVKKQWGTDPYGAMLATVQFGYRFAAPTNGKEVLEIIKRHLDLIRDELVGVIETLAAGPIPGTTPTEDV